jgi:hypothetical protein
LFHAGGFGFTATTSKPYMLHREQKDGEREPGPIVVVSNDRRKEAKYDHSKKIIVLFLFVPST